MYQWLSARFGWKVAIFFTASFAAGWQVGLLLR